MDGDLYFPICGLYSFLHVKSRKIDIIFSMGDICSSVDKLGQNNSWFLYRGSYKLIRLKVTSRYGTYAGQLILVGVIQEFYSGCCSNSVPAQPKYLYK